MKPVWVTSLLLLLSSTALQAVETDETRLPLYLGLGLGVEGYADADHNSYARGRTVRLGWHNRWTGERARVGRPELHAQISHTYEQEAERNDEQRYSEHVQWFVDGVHPLRPLSGHDRPWLLSGWGWLEGGENHQQLEEREFMGAVGAGLDKRLGRGTTWDLRLGAALACNEEEKDDDRPRIAQSIGEEQLNRNGCGYFGRWYNTITLPTATEFGLNLDHYEGAHSYGNKEYRRSRAHLYMEVPLVRSHHLLRVMTRTIIRDSETDLIGFEDRLNQVALQYYYHF